MGNDFIRKATDPYRKGWARGTKELTRQDLFTIKPEELQIILVRPLEADRITSSICYLIHIVSDEILVFEENVRVGTGVNTPISVINRIRDLGGKTVGMLYSVHSQSGLVSMSISL